MLVLAVLVTSLLAATSVSIVEPVDGETYYGDWLPLRVIVENNNEVPDSVHYSLNGALPIQVSRLNTDWYTYMKDSNRNGSTESPAPLSSEIMWTANVTGTYHEFISPIVVNGRLYHASEDQETAYCLDAATGEILWSFPNLGDPIDDALVYDNGLVYVASDSVWCLDAISGDRVWAYLGHDDYEMVGPPAISGGTLYSVEWKPGSSYVTALSSADGTYQWETHLPQRTATTPTVSDEFVLVATNGGPLYALSRDNGEMVWENTDSEDGYWDTSPILVGETIFIGGNDECVHSIDLSTGALNWETEIGGDVECTPCYYQGKLFVGSAFPGSEKKIACVDAETGTIIWESEGGLHASMGFASGYCYWGDTWDGTINCTDSVNGDLVWSYQTSSSVCGIVSSPAIVDGVMFIAATDSCLYAFGTGFKYTYMEDYFYANVGSNELVVTSWDNGAVVATDTIGFTVTQTGITLEPSRQMNLYACPNPIGDSASICFELEEPGYTSVRIFDLSGREVSTLLEQELVSGTHSVQWNGCGDSGHPLTSGLYLCSIEHKGAVETTGLCLLR